MEETSPAISVFIYSFIQLKRFAFQCTKSKGKICNTHNNKNSSALIFEFFLIEEANYKIS